MKHVAIYIRVSSKQQDQRSQEPDLKHWIEGQDEPVVWYRDKFTGRTMERPGMKTLMEEINAGRVSTVVVWRLDRLGRTAKDSQHSSRNCVTGVSVVAPWGPFSP